MASVGLRLLIAGGVLALLFHRIPAGEVWAVLRSARPELVSLGIGITVLNEVLIARRLRLLTAAHHLEASTREILGINLATRFYALGLPGGNALGMALRIHRIVRGSGRYADVVVCVLLDRLVTTGAMTLFGLVFALLEHPSVPVMIPAVLAGATLVLATGYVVVLWRPGWSFIAPMWRRLERRLPSRIAALRQSTCRVEHPLALTLAAWSLSMVVHVLGVATFWVVARAIGVEISALALAWIRSTALLAAALPVTIAGLGVREGILVALLVGLGVPDSPALAFSLLLFATTTLAMGIAGAVVELAQSRSGRLA
ncbi:MAG: lysylphosphatidylglycerol synthase transmembrane domain-containing protein [Candidatus Eisenbacteria bacterium]